MTLIYIIGYGLVILFAGLICGGNRAMDEREHGK